MAHFLMHLFCCSLLTSSVMAERVARATKKHEQSKHDGSTEEETVHLRKPGDAEGNPKTSNAASVFVGSSASYRYLTTQRQVENGLAFTANTFAQSKCPTMPYAGEYVPPGGKLDPGEDAETAVKRELYEEVLSFWDGWTTGAAGAQSLKVVQVEEVITKPFFHKRSSVWRNYNIKYFKLDVEAAENVALKPILTPTGVENVTAAYKAVEVLWASIKANQELQDAYLDLPTCHKEHHSPETHKAELMTLAQAVAATAENATDSWRDSEIKRCGGDRKSPAGAHALLRSNKTGF